MSSVSGGYPERPSRHRREFIALIITAKQFAVVISKFQFTAVDHLVGIFDSLLQTTVGRGELRIRLSLGNGSHLIRGQRIVTPYQISTCQNTLCSLLRRHAGITIIIFQQIFSIRQVAYNLSKHVADALAHLVAAAVFGHHGNLTPQLGQLQVCQTTQELSLTNGCIISSGSKFGLVLVNQVDGLVNLYDTQEKVVENLHLIPSVGSLFETAVHRTCFTFLTLKRNQFVRVQFDDERER